MVKHTQTIRRQQPANCLSMYDLLLPPGIKGLVQYSFHLT